MSEKYPTKPVEGTLPPGVHLPRPTVWPMALAGGIVLFLGGLILGPAFSVAGLLVIAMSIGGWIRELMRE